MKMFVDPDAIYLHRKTADFRKSINGLALMVEQEMKLSPMSPALFMFCSRTRNRVKALYWDRTGFCLWYKFGARPVQMAAEVSGTDDGLER